MSHWSWVRLEVREVFISIESSFKDFLMISLNDFLWDYHLQINYVDVKKEIYLYQILWMGL